MKVGELVLRLVNEHPDWTNEQVADEVRRQIPSAKTTPASVSSTKSTAKPAGSLGTFKPSAGDTPKRPRKGTARYKSMAIGNAQNWVVRNLLGRLGDHSFEKGDWERVRDETFEGRCAYCGEAGETEIEHAVPINMEKLGEHHLGNLVPACQRCNSDKGKKDYVEFLADRPDRKKAIDDHMARKSYVPLRGDGPERVLLQHAHEEIRALAERFARLLDELGGANGRRGDGTHGVVDTDSDRGSPGRVRNCGTAERSYEREDERSMA